MISYFSFCTISAQFVVETVIDNYELYLCLDYIGIYNIYLEHNDDDIEDTNLNILSGIFLPDILMYIIWYSGFVVNDKPMVVLYCFQEFITYSLTMDFEIIDFI